MSLIQRISGRTSVVAAIAGSAACALALVAATGLPAASAAKSRTSLAPVLSLSLGAETGSSPFEPRTFIVKAVPGSAGSRIELQWFPAPGEGLRAVWGPTRSNRNDGPVTGRLDASGTAQFSVGTGNMSGKFRAVLYYASGSVRAVSPSLGFPAVDLVDYGLRYLPTAHSLAVYYFPPDPPARVSGLAMVCPAMTVSAALGSAVDSVDVSYVAPTGYRVSDTILPDAESQHRVFIRRCWETGWLGLAVNDESRAGQWTYSATGRDTAGNVVWTRSYPFVMRSDPAEVTPPRLVSFTGPGDVIAKKRTQVRTGVFKAVVDDPEWLLGTDQMSPAFAITHRKGRYAWQGYFNCSSKDFTCQRNGRYITFTGRLLLEQRLLLKSRTLLGRWRFEMSELRYIDPMGDGEGNSGNTLELAHPAIVAFKIRGASHLTLHVGKPVSGQRLLSVKTTQASKPFPRAKVKVYFRKSGSARFNLRSTVRTDNAGIATLHVKPVRHGTWRVVLAATKKVAGATVTVSV